MGRVANDDHRLSVGSEALDVLAFALDAPPLPHSLGEQIGQILVAHEPAHANRSYRRHALKPQYSP